MEQVSVLIVDQDEANRNFLAQMLRKKSYEVYYASSGRAGVETASQHLPSLIVFDPDFPDINALDFIRNLKGNQRTSRIPCVVLSSKSNPEEMQALLQAGCAEYYIKSGMVMVTFVEAIPKLLLEAKRVHPEAQEGLSIVFLSAKGGTGTSSLCANIGMNIALHIQQSSVVVADMVLPIGSIAPIVGHQEGDFNLVTISERPDEKITPEYFKNNLVSPAQWLFHLLPGSPDPETASRLEVKHMPNIVDALRKTHDYVLIDLGRSLSRISMPIIQEADLVVLVLSTDLSTVSLTKRVWDYLSAQGIEAKKVFAILNRAVGLEGLTKAEAEKILGLPIRLMMPYMMGNFTLANNQHIPLSVKFPTDTASMVLKQAAIEMSRQAIASE